MEQKDIVIGGKYLHKDKKTIETVIYLGKVKIDGKWQDSVVYKGIDYNTEKPCVFTRTLEDFCDNFEKLDCEIVTFFNSHTIIDILYDYNQYRKSDRKDKKLKYSQREIGIAIDGAISLIESFLSKEFIKHRQNGTKEDN